MVAFFLICAGALHGGAACIRGGMLAGGGAGRLDGGQAWAQYSVQFSLWVSAVICAAMLTEVGGMDPTAVWTAKSVRVPPSSHHAFICGGVHGSVLTRADCWTFVNRFSVRS